MVIQHNMLAMNTSRQLGIVKGSVAASTEKLSSGYRINRSADDAAGLSISEKMRHQIRGLDRGASNIEEGIGYCQTADGALQEMEEMCQRINELAVQAANGTNSETDRAYIDEEIQQLKEEIDRICITTKYNDEYIFRCEDKIKDEKQGYYLLNFSGSPNDVQIYNETYDAATGAATYGGVVYNSVRYAWSTISAGMYDATTGLFQEGEYSFATQDGTTLKFICEDGTKPPEVIREFYMVASENGINIDGEEIPWKKVVDASGKSLNPGNIEQTTYSFFHNGVKISFMPDMEDDFQDVIAKLSYTRWQSKYQMPHEETAVQVVNNNSKAYIQNKSQVEEALKGNTDFLGYEYTLCAGDGSSGSDGLWLEKNGATVGTSLTTWAGVDMADWGDLSDDIDENRSPDYKYSYAPAGNNEASVDFQYRVINEISKDSLIDALDGMTFKTTAKVQVDNGAQVDFAVTDRVVGMSVRDNTLDYTLEEEYALGRDFSVAQDIFGDSSLEYDAVTEEFRVKYTGTDLNGNAVEYVYQTGTTMTNTINSLADKIYMSINQDYLKLIRLRYLEGASNPTVLNLSELVGGNLTGKGSSTYFEETVTIDPTDVNWKRTTGNGSIGNTTTLASSSIDFSGFGTNYNLSDLMGLGFNTTCHTCSNHYSVQFTTPAATNTTWKSFVAEDGNTYEYAMLKDRSHYTLYLNINSMQGKLTNGVQLSNAIVDAISASDFDFHFTQYATKKDSAVLHMYDNRPQYVQNGVSTATKATFEPFSYTFNPIATVDIDLYDTTDTRDYLKLRYQYNYTDLLDASNLSFVVTEDSNGDYVEVSLGKYEPYTGDASQSGLKRVKVEISYNISKDDMKDYVEKTMFANIANSSNVQLKSNNYASVRLATTVNSNKAMVTDFDTPVQVMDEAVSKVKEKVSKEYLKIQCSANSQDLLYIEKQRLSVYRLEMYKLNTRTQGAATSAIDMVSNAIQKLNTVRSCFGAYQNRLEHSYAINLNTQENTTYAESGIRDTDMAEEMVAYSNSSVLQQAGQSMLAQANQSNQGILQLLQ